MQIGKKEKDGREHRRREKNKVEKGE